MEKIISGKAYVLGDNVDTDQIIPAEYLMYDPSRADERRLFGRLALSGVPAGQAGLPKGKIEFVDQGDKENMHYVIGDLVTLEKTFRISFILKTINNQLLIHQLRIEDA